MTARTRSVVRAVASLPVRVWRWTRILAELVKFEHTIFALPFALLSAVLAGDSLGYPHGIPALRTLAWILAAMVGARTAAMAFNRIVDAPYDSRNPRTAGRAIPQGLVRPWQAWLLTAASATLLLVAAANLNRLCLYLSPVALLAVTTYSLTKRFTQWTHLALGAAIGIAPVGAWIAVTGEFAWTPVLMWAAVTLWIAGFDIIYALQDIEVDRRLGMFSLPAQRGPESALRISRLFHMGMLAALGLLGIAANLAGWYYGGLVAVAVILGYEHSIVRPDDFRRVNTAFFVLNGWVSVGLLVFVVLDRW